VGGSDDEKNLHRFQCSPITHEAELRSKIADE
jgi:hypothetical protein